MRATSVTLQNAEQGRSVPAHSGLLVVNADDWGRDKANTNSILDCTVCGSLSSVSAMVFMEDSARAAVIARERGIDAGLHLNFTTPFSAPGLSTPLAEHQQRLSRYLRSSRLAQVVFHPGLAKSFEYIVKAQLDEFERLYGEEPRRLDGHHHMHLCANVVFRDLMPSGTIVRRNFTFRRGEKGFFNRFYRRVLDSRLRRRHRISDFLFSLAPLEPSDRLMRVFSLAHKSVVELETHPVIPEEYRFLTQGGIFRIAGDLRIAPRFSFC